MKTYKVKNYKGNLVESLSKFQEKYPEIKVCEVSEEKDILKIKGETRQLVKEEIEPYYETEDGDVGYRFKPKTLDIDTVLEILNKFKKEHGNSGVVVWFDNPRSAYNIDYDSEKNLVCFYAMKHFG